MRKLTSDLSEKEGFLEAKTTVLTDNYFKDGIGTYKEKVLHKVIKFFLEPNEEYHEIKYLGSIADIKRGDEIFEIQTRSLSNLNKKLEKFLNNSKVTVVYPIPYVKYITWFDNKTQEMSARRKSPKCSTVFDAVYEIYNIRKFIKNENFSVKILFINVDDIKLKGGRLMGKQKKSMRIDRIPISLEKTVDLNTQNDYKVFIPKNLPESFTASSLSKAVSPKFKYGYSIIKILAEAQLITEVEKIGRKKIYKLINE